MNRLATLPMAGARAFIVWPELFNACWRKADMGTILFVVTEHGYWGEECIAPLEAVREAGYETTVATPSGNRPPIDETSTDPEQVGEETASWIQSVHESDDDLQEPIALGLVNPDAYDAVVYPGGHGTVWDVNQDTHARAILRETLEAGRPALVVCHAVGILAFARDKHGAFIVNGRDVTGFPNAWEEDVVDEHDVMHDGRKLPYWVEDEVETAGGNWQSNLEEDTSVVVDGSLITARGPESSDAAATQLLETLEA